MPSAQYSHSLPNGTAVRRELSTHVTRGFSAISSEVSASLEVMVTLLEANVPRPVDANFLGWVHVYVDASLEPDGYSGLGLSFLS